jgi:transcriptional regulator with GAF, ATPase, and Fis domain/ligand-binding sensor domain-containing protein
MGILKFIIIFSLLFQINIIAQQYPIINYTRDRGLPGNQVWDIYQDNEGYIWFATSAGLFRYNGRDYQHFGEKDGFLNDWPLRITGDNDSVLWVSCERGVSSFKNGEVHSWILRSAETMMVVFKDSYNRVWTYSTLFPGDVCYFLNDSLHNFSDEYNFKNQAILNITEDQEGGIFFLTRNGKIYKYFAEHLSEILINTLYKININYIFIDSKNNMFICANQGLGVINTTTYRSNPKIHWLIKLPIRFGIQGSSGKYWFVAVENGLIRLNGLDLNHSKQNILHLTERNGLLSNDIRMLYKDREKNIWIGYSFKGVSKISTLMFCKYNEADGLNTSAIFTISKFRGSIFCTTAKGIYKMQNRRFTKFDDSNEYSQNWYTCLVPINESIAMVGSALGVYQITGDLTIKLVGLENKIILSMLKDHSGKIWIGTQQGLFTLEGNIFIDQDYDVEGRSINKLTEVEGKNLYIGTDKGLYIAENATNPFGKKRTLRPKNKILSESISDIAVDTDSTILIAARNGLIILPQHRDSYKVEGLKNIEVISLLIDSKKNLWVGTTRGLYQLRKNNDDIYEIVNHYSESEGLASNEFSFNNTIYEDTDGKIYFGMFGGIAVYTPSENHSRTQKPKAYINGIHINDTTLSLFPGEDLELPSSQNKVSFICDGLSFSDEDFVKFEYYLSPIEKPWSNVTTNSTITYGYLEPDEYKFYMRAVNHFGIMSDLQSVSLTIVSPFWKHSWFIILLVITLIFIGYEVNNYRQKQIKKRNLQLEELVQKKTKDLEESKAQVEKQFQQLVEAQNELVEKRELAKAHKEIELLKERLTKENIYLREKHGIIQEVSSIIGKSQAIEEVRKKVVEIAQTGSTVLITGPTGVGKNLVAEAIHDLSSRKKRTLITVNCAAIPDSLVESELFGHERGAFTGAVGKQEGKFEIAEESTLFLDEIGDMPLVVQAKLLNVLQSKKFMRIGGNQEIKVNARIIAASNQNLSKLVEQGTFRRDLFYRINVYTISIPALQERPDDIEPITKYFITRFAITMNKKIISITKSALNILQNYSYPGNIRELENIIHRAVIICKGDTITDEEILILPAVHNDGEDDYNADKLLTLDELERKHIINVLKKTHWKIKGNNGAADILEIDPGTLRSRMKKLGIPFLRQKST